MDSDPPTCALLDEAGAISARLERARYEFCLVVSAARIVLGSVARGALASSEGDETAERLMVSGPSTVRPNTPVSELVERLAKRELATAIVTTPGGCLLGVFHRAEGERYLAGAGQSDA